MQTYHRARLRYQIAGAKLLVNAARMILVRRKYHPDQPRAPAGRPDGGRWIPWTDRPDVAGPFDELNRAKCEAQYESDMFQCKFVASGRSRWACEEQAMTRYVSCMKDLPVPPHNYYLGDAQ